jgi:hypothetical protein
MDTLLPHKDESQVRLDVIRSFTHLDSETSNVEILRRTAEHKRAGAKGARIITKDLCELSVFSFCYFLTVE